MLAALWGGAAGWDRCWREGGGAAVQDVTLYLLYILQAAGVWLQGGGVLHHLVHCDDQEDEIELSEESNGSVNTRRCAHRPRGSQNTVNLSMSIKRGGGLLHVHRLIQ